jgi:hypothetical protein
MEKAVLTPLQSEVQYRGSYSEPLLDLVSDFLPLLKRLLQRLTPFGVSFKTTRIDGIPAGEAHLAFSNPDLNFTGRVFLDRFELLFPRFHEVGQDLAEKILSAVWAALSEIVPSASLASHWVFLNFTAEIGGSESYRSLLQRFVAAPPTLPPGADAGVVFYWPADPEVGLTAASVVVDKIAGQDRLAMLKSTFLFGDAQITNLRTIALNVIGRTFEQIGLDVDLRS